MAEADIESPPIHFWTTCPKWVFDIAQSHGILGKLWQIRALEEQIRDDHYLGHPLQLATWVEHGEVHAVQILMQC